MRKSFILGALLATSALAVPGTSFAQSAPAEKERGSDADIIVTARRAEERLQDVPISITVFNQEQLTARNIYTPSDLGAYTPSLSVNSRFGPEKAVFSIRGFVQEQGTQPSVGVYFADVPGVRGSNSLGGGNGTTVGNMFDLQNIQVLKGPQGTLFGRNTTGGAILLVPQKPTDKLEGYVEGSLGNFAMKRAQAVVNVPLSDTFKVRAGVDWQERDGYLKNISGTGPSRLGDVNYIAARLSVLANLTPDLENYTVASYSYSHNNGIVPHMGLCDQAAATGGNFIASVSCAQVARDNGPGQDIYTVESDITNPTQKMRQWQIVNTTTWTASDAFKVKNIISYGEETEQGNFDNNGTNLVVAPGVSLHTINLFTGVSGHTSSQSGFTEELQFQGKTLDGKLDWQAGGYLELSRPRGFSSSDTEIFTNCTNIAARQCGPGTVSSVAIKSSYTTKALYAQATYKLTSQLSLTTGVRYTSDKASTIAQEANLSFSAPNTFTTVCQNSTNVVVSVANCQQNFAVASNRATWVINLDYKPTDDVMVYAKWARGYRAGAINPSNYKLETWQPEKVDTYEVGAKTAWQGAMPGNLNLAAYYNDFRNQQLAIGEVPDGGPNSPAGFGGALAIVNAGKSRMWGLEADASIKPVPGLRLDVGYAYLNTKLEQITLPAAPLGILLFAQSAAGGPLAYSPKHRVTLAGNYTLPLPSSVGDVSLGANFVYTSELLSSAGPLQVIQPTSQLNLDATWKGVMGSPVDLGAFVTNVTNNKYYTASMGVYSFLYVDGGSTNLPRMFGVRMKVHLGK